MAVEDVPAQLRHVLESAAELQRRVPDAVLVGGSAAALHAHHRISFDHDHVVADLQSRYQQVLEAVEATDGWATSIRASKPPMTIMGSLDDVEAGLRQLRRRVPLETQQVRLRGDLVVTVPTIEETLRVKAYLVVQRNQVRDYLDVAALADALTLPESAAVLGRIDHYYVDRTEEGDAVSTILVQRLAEPSPRDRTVLDQLPRYKGLRVRWQNWNEVVAVTRELAQLVLEEER